ncbi:hypothetical protein [Thermococcus aciditolerans]|uniref:Uncharacterized protein n=1 Tax=Thermococcus aciditolerans TaxID=2598455 RepID=A0A5C0SLR1_9EURY|nr:hypothetical protein [Thermococcus aciditolerans]QEK14374.1 hypothetical protein FPV09_03785 [Thermococcus aciditolerans]
MRKLLYALPFLILATGFLMVDFRPAVIVPITLNWLTFWLEYRYGSESKEGDELIALGISMSSVLIPAHQAFAELLAFVIFVLELTALFVKFKLRD